MRTIKFRAWDNEKGMYFSPTYEAYRGNLEDLSISTNGRLQLRTLEQAAIDESVFPNRFIVEEFTGLTDKNGNEIYEGDILSGVHPNNPTRVVWDEKLASFCLIAKGWMYRHWFGESCNPENVEVIGNIHETTGLL